MIATYISYGGCQDLAEHEEPLCVAVRYHQRPVPIHPFPNGNGRHGRQAVTT